MTYESLSSAKVSSDAAGDKDRMVPRDVPQIPLATEKQVLSTRSEKMGFIRHLALQASFSLLVSEKEILNERVEKNFREQIKVLLGVDDDVANEIYLSSMAAVEIEAEAMAQAYRESKCTEALAKGALAFSVAPLEPVEVKESIPAEILMKPETILLSDIKPTEVLSKDTIEESYALPATEFDTPVFGLGELLAKPYVSMRKFGQRTLEKAGFIKSVE